MVRVAFLVIALATAAMAAMPTGSVARDEFGIPLDVIRVDALRPAGVMLAVVVGGPLLMRRRMPDTDLTDPRLRSARGRPNGEN
jgi:hypothetical protein